MKKPIISCLSFTFIARGVAGVILTAITVACLVFPKGGFAEQSVVPLQITLDENPAEIPSAVNPQIAQNTIREQELIVKLMQDVIISVNPEPKAGWKRVHMRVTGYCPCSQCCGVFSDGITANNHLIRPGDTFAAADKTYPFGTEMVIPGYNDGQIVEVKDRGGAIKGNRLDLFFHTHEKALIWGVQYLDVLVKVE